jgi:CheY-like chemotaxis protein
MKGIPFHLLIVEDDEDDRDIIDEVFSEIGYQAEVKKFINGQSLLHYLEQIDPSLHPSLIVLDNSLPGLNAIDLLKTLKESPVWQHIPVVIYTTVVTPGKEKQWMEQGAYRCIQKGNNKREIMEVAKELKRVAEGS